MLRRRIALAGLLLAAAGRPAGAEDPCQLRAADAARWDQLNRVRSTRGNPGFREEVKTTLARLKEHGLACDQQNCARGVADACHGAANALFERGEAARARKYMDKACRAGRKLDCDALEAGQALIRHSEELRSQEERRCAGSGRGSAEACTSAGTLYFRDGLWPEARENYRKACDQGVAQGCANLALAQWRLGRSAEARSSLGKACHMGLTSACNRNLAAVREPW